MKHLSVRVAWHDNKWNGTVCCNPNLNTFCTHLPRIYEEKNSEEQKIKGKEWADLSEKELPPCKSESGGFMNKKEYKRTFKHPYSKDKELPHGNLLETTFELPKFSTFAVPFWWMLKNNQKWIDENYPNLSADEKAKFNTSWVYSNHRQRDLLNLFFDEIEEKKSLIVFYTKNGNPIDEDAGRLIVGIGQIVKKSSTLE